MSSAPFPSLLIRPDGFVPQGAFAEAQAEYLDPDRTAVRQLDALLREKNAGVVAHFYMDPQLQGVLTACEWPHVHISDSLMMADAAIEMAKAGVTTVIVLGVDFMSENVRAMLDASGFSNVEVFRVAAEPIGCSLAEAAESREYAAYMEQARRTPRSLHVVYINTSLRTKAETHARVPTITCTSSNVVRTILQAAAQIPDVHVWYGPDTYMGRNLETLFHGLVELGDDAIRAVHPAHDRASLAAFLPRFHHFRKGVCIVHHMFGADVAGRVQRDYPDALVTAHLEVPGEMFALGWEGQRRGSGVVGSTSDILAFIQRRVRDAGSSAAPERLRFVLATEAGMITSIVRDVRKELAAQKAAGASTPDVEIIFPVASEAIARTDDPELALVPGVATGEGCSVAGGCATCPYMKMSSLDATLDLLARIGVVPGATLAPFHPRTYAERIDGRTTAEVGGEPILHMRHFQKTRELSATLVADVLARNAAPPLAFGDK